MRILVVEDEERIAEQIGKALTKNGFTVDICDTIADAFELSSTEQFDALIADRMLPDGDALELVAALRRPAGNMPILLLTARDAIDDRVAGLEAGADDYLVKPFAMAELVARMRALLRRPDSVFGRVQEIGQLSYDYHTRVATVFDRSLHLPRHELMVLELLLLSANRVVTKEVLIDKVYGLEIPDSNTIPVHIHNLRRRLKEESAGASIRTFRGLGYMLTEVKAKK